MTDSDFDEREEAEQVEREEDREDRPRKRHPMDFDYWPSDEQMEAFKRGVK